MKPQVQHQAGSTNAGTPDGALIERLNEIEGRIRAVRSEIGVPGGRMRVMWMFLRHEYGFISFVLLSLAAAYYTVRYQVSPFQDLADPAHSKALARTYTAIGDRMMAAGQWEQARAAFGEALKLDARNARASYHAHLAQLLVLGEPSVVDAALAQLVENTKDDAVVLFVQGIVNLRRRQYPAAAALFRRSIEADPAFLGSRINLAAVSLRMGDYATYHMESREAYRLDSGFSIAINNMAYAHELRHEFPAATRLYHRLDTLGSTALTRWLIGASMLYHDPAGAEQYLGASIGLLNVEYPDTLAALGRAWSVGYVPAVMNTPLTEHDVAMVAGRREKLGCVLVTYAMCDALAENFTGANAKLRRACAMLDGNRELLRILGLQVESVASLSHCTSAASGWLHAAALQLKELP